MDERKIPMHPDEHDRTVTTRSTSKTTARTPPVVLRETQTTRLVFRPELLADNSKNPEALVRGTIVFERKTQRGHWRPEPTDPLSSIKAGELRKLELRSEDLLQLHTGVSDLYELVRQRGVQPGTAEWLRSEDAAKLRELMASDDTVRSGIGAEGSDLLTRVIRIASAMPHTALDQLGELTSDQLTNFSSIIGTAKLANFLRTYRDNVGNSNEAYWQKVLRANSWVISQVFVAPMVIHRGQAFVGGKGMGNRGGKIADFAYRNRLTKNIALVEIKTPCTNLLEKRQYRDGVYAVSKEVAGGIAQLLTARNTLIEDLATLQKNARIQDEEEFEAFRPRAVLIVGDLEREAPSASMIRSLEVVRNELRDVEVVTFDEVAAKIEALLSLLKMDAPAAE